MSILAELVDHVIGVDPDRDRVTAAVVDPLTRGEIAWDGFGANLVGYGAALEWADSHSVAGQRVWAIEGSGSWGAGMARALRAEGEWVIEFSFPSGPAAADGSKTDHLDALRAGREVLGRTRWVDPRNVDGHAGAIAAISGLRELLVGQRTALINHLKSLLVTGPTSIRENLAALTTPKLVAACSRLRPSPEALNETADTRFALRAAAKQITGLNDAIAALYERLDAQITLKAPQLLAERGVGPVTAAPIIMAWSHQGRIHSEAAFAKLSGTCPIEANSGQQQGRLKLNRQGDRRLNRALYTIVLSRSATDPETKAYIARRVTEGKTPREARRCLKRYTARRLYRLLENPPPTQLDKP